MDRNFKSRWAVKSIEFQFWIVCGGKQILCWEIRNIGDAAGIECDLCYWSSGGLPCQESCDGWVLLWVVNPAAGNISLSRVFFASENIWTCETWGQSVTHRQGDQTSFACLPINFKSNRFTRQKSTFKSVKTREMQKACDAKRRAMQKGVWCKKGVRCKRRAMQKVCNAKKAPFASHAFFASQAFYIACVFASQAFCILRVLHRTSFASHAFCISRLLHRTLFASHAFCIARLFASHVFLHHTPFASHAFLQIQMLIFGA